MFRNLTAYLETRAPSFIGWPIFTILAVLLSIGELLVNLDNIFKPLDKWR